ncbi:unnamed protein product [Clavelina lepadiformis]|uniref:Uncharacterized protein n=1 Tax=Clavelina lepadiformis TaxID=159417 RepID=A0ABP0FQY5_CLALP
MHFPVFGYLTGLLCESYSPCGNSIQRSSRTWQVVTVRQISTKLGAEYEKSFMQSTCQQSLKTITSVLGLTRFLQVTSSPVHQLVGVLFAGDSQSKVQGRIGSTMRQLSVTAYSSDDHASRMLELPDIKHAAVQPAGSFKSSAEARCAGLSAQRSEIDEAIVSGGGAQCKDIVR